MALFQEEKGTLLIFESYLSAIRNSVGSELFRNAHSEIDGVRTDVLRDGDLSCAFYVSSILKIFDLITEVHSEVDATVSDMVNTGWYRVELAAPGDVLVWTRKRGASGEVHRHIGFYIGNERAVNTSPEEQCVIESHWTFEGARDIEAVYRTKL